MPVFVQYRSLVEVRLGLGDVLVSDEAAADVSTGSIVKARGCLCYLQPSC